MPAIQHHTQRSLCLPFLNRRTDMLWQIADDLIRHAVFFQQELRFLLPDGICKAGIFDRKLYIQKWHTRVPDMSRLFRRWMPPKRLPANPTSAQIELMVQETCVAEFTHLALLAVGLPVLWLWPGPGGIALYAVDALLGNGIFILIQRFNRPKLMHLCERLKKRGL